MSKVEIRFPFGHALAWAIVESTDARRGDAAVLAKVRAVSVCAVLALAVLGGILFGDYFRGGVGK